MKACETTGSLRNREVVVEEVGAEGRQKWPFYEGFWNADMQGRSNATRGTNAMLCGNKQTLCNARKETVEGNVGMGS